MPIPVLIADDESHCRLELRHLLSKYQQLTVVGEAVNGIEALEMCRSHKPDLLFLDIQMPGLNGLEAAASLGADAPQIIFVTAYDQHAIRAFELGAIDYLLKPVDEQRLERTVERALKQLNEKSSNNQMDALMKAWSKLGQEFLSRIVARKGQKIFIVPVEEVYCFEMESQMLYAVTERERLWTDYQMKTLEARLDPKLFARVHRESIVNINYVREIAPITKERYELTLSNNHKLSVSRNYLPQLKEMIGWV